MLQLFCFFRCCDMWSIYFRREITDCTPFTLYNSAIFSANLDRLFFSMFYVALSFGLLHSCIHFFLWMIQQRSTYNIYSVLLPNHNLWLTWLTYTCQRHPPFVDHRIIIKGQLLVLHVFWYVSPREGPGPAAGIHWFSTSGSEAKSFCPWPWVAMPWSASWSDLPWSLRRNRDLESNTQRTVHVGHWFVMVCPVMVCP